MFKPALEVLEDRTMPTNFSLLPPEINSALLFAGAGSGPLSAAASAWDGLAVELNSAAASFASVPSGLVAGPSAPTTSVVTTAAAWDGLANFPRSPINLLADLNALAGLLLVHGNYPN